MYKFVYVFMYVEYGFNHGFGIIFHHAYQE